MGHCVHYGERNNWLKPGCQACRLNNCYGVCTYYLGAARLMWMEFTRNMKGSSVNEFTEVEQSGSSSQSWSSLGLPAKVS